MACGEWMGTGVAGEEPADQRHDDAFSLVFDTVRLEARLEVLGAPEIEIEIASDKPVAQLCARLCDVAPDGSSRRISYGVLNLTHRDSHAEPSALEAGRFYRIRLKLNDCGYAFDVGHVMRLALSTAYWPLIWPAPEAATLTIRGAGTLTLPVRPIVADEPSPRFERPARGHRAPSSKVAEGRRERHASFDLLGGHATYVTKGEGGLFGEGVLRYGEIDTTVGHDLERHLTIAGGDPLCASYHLSQSYQLGRDEWRIRIETHTSMRATATTFELEGTVQAFENGALVATRHWPVSIPRDLV